MDKKKIFTSLNDKKGVLFQKEGDDFSVSIWKKETPVAIVINKEEALKICEFITSNIKISKIDEAENERKINFWVNYIEEFKAKTLGVKDEKE